nr:hypothetical protein [Haliea sp. SAOS-164]
MLEASADFRAAHLDRSALEVDVLPGERNQFGDSEPRPKGETHHVDFLLPFGRRPQDGFDFGLSKRVGIFPVTEWQFIDGLYRRVVAHVMCFSIFENAAQNNHDFVDGFVGESDEVQCDQFLDFCFRDRCELVRAPTRTKVIFDFGFVIHIG